MLAFAKLDRSPIFIGRNVNLKFDSDSLIDFATGLLLETGLSNSQSIETAQILVEGDLLGHGTHGLQLLPAYLSAALAGSMTSAGEPQVVSDRGGAFVWDGRYLPGPWLVARALDEMFDRVGDHAVVAATIRRSHHIGCLAAYLRRATDRGLMLILCCSDPSVASVAPHGARSGVYTPNPIAAGYPTSDGPVWIDVCASTTTNGMVARLNRVGGKLPGPWLVDEEGRPSDDPSVMAAGASGAILPLGGVELGHKGFALGLLVEALTSGLSGFGRADGAEQWGASVFMLVLDPGAFAGSAAFERETGWLADACRFAAPRVAGSGVRMPGARAQALRDMQLRSGVALHPETLAGLESWATRLGVPLPRPVT
jgi:LDH2 family malate/lactate/ureidoglycolate dehydrogenase